MSLPRIHDEVPELRRELREGAAHDDIPARRYLHRRREVSDFDTVAVAQAPGEPSMFTLPVTAVSVIDEFGVYPLSQ